MQFIHFLTSLVGGGGGSGGGGAEESHHHSDDADTATPTRVLWERPLPDPSPGSDDDDGGISVAVVGILDEDDAKRVRTREDLQEEEQQQQDEEDRDALAVMELVSEERPSKQQVLSSGLDHDDDGAASALNDDEKGREAIYEDWVRLHHDIQGMVGDKPVDAPQQQRQILVDEDPINAALCNVRKSLVSSEAFQSA